MKITPLALISSLIASANAADFNSLVRKMTGRDEASAAADAAVTATETATPTDIDAIDVIDADADDAQQRELQTNCWSNGNLNTRLTQQWHPVYSAGWTNGYCRFTADCNSPGYSTQLACCKGAYAGQSSGNCLNGLPSPPTNSPTKKGTTGALLDVYFPDYRMAWPDAYCVNQGPLPNGRPTYSTMLACCKGAYAGQASGKCLSMLPSPPTGAPSTTEADFWYPDYATPYADAYCKNTLPLPFRSRNDRPTYSTMLACCKGAYRGQTSGKCLSKLPSPPTTSPTTSISSAPYYPDYNTPWASATCINTRPIPNGRVSYATQLACCKGAYAGQTSGACLNGLASPPTSSPTTKVASGPDAWYPNMEDFARGTCINTRPAPNGPTRYASKQACCSGFYSSQISHFCQCEINSCFSCNCAGAASCANLKCT